MAHFPITHKNPEVQIWFDQGNTLLPHFGDCEAERAFRWAYKVEPESSMVYGGLARATGGDRSKEFIREAAKRKNFVTPRERLYMEALEAQIKTDTFRDRKSNYENRQRAYLDILETISVRYPGDLEARAPIALTGTGDNRYLGGAHLIVAPAQRSASAIRKAHTKHTTEGATGHSFQTLLGDRATIVKNIAAIHILTQSTTIQQSALDLPGPTLRLN